MKFFNRLKRLFRKETKMQRTLRLATEFNEAYDRYIERKYRKCDDD